MSMYVDVCDFNKQFGVAQSSKSLLNDEQFGGILRKLKLHLSRSSCVFVFISLFGVCSCFLVLLLYFIVFEVYFFCFLELACFCDVPLA